MIFRTAGAIATLLLGIASTGGQALAQYYPASPAYPPPQAHPAEQGYPSHRPLVPVAEGDPQQLYDAQGRPVQLYDAQGRPMSPAAIVPQATEPPADPRHGGGGPAHPAEATVPPPPGSAYRDAAPQAPQGLAQQAARGELSLVPDGDPHMCAGPVFVLQLDRAVELAGHEGAHDRRAEAGRLIE